MTINPEHFQKFDYTFLGIFRGLVENNVDPLDAGRVQVRIYGIHSFDGNITPVEELPWAVQALGLTWSGGYNIKNKDYGPENGPNTKYQGRYNVGNNSEVLGTSYNIYNYPTDPTDEFVDKRVDPVSNACGTGGEFVVPKRGNWVFLFFEGGNHDKPVYFATAPNARDWSFTKTWRTTSLNSKIDQINAFRKDFNPRPVSLPKQGSWADKAVVNSLVDKPDLSIQPPVIDGEEDTSNRDIQCMTSANGTTVIIDQRNGREQIFVIHKNYLEYTDKFGNRKIYVGKKRNKNSGPTSNDIEEPCHYEIGVEGNHELHVLGNYDVYAKGRIHIQCDSHVQIDANNTVGLTVREGDVDLIVKKGNVNADIAGNLDADVKNINIHVNDNSNIKIDGNAKLTVSGNVDVLSEGDIKMTGRNIDINASENLKMNGSNINLTSSQTRISNDCHIGNNLFVNNQTDVSGQVRIGNQLFVDVGINCGGFLRNNGLADLGSPVILHGVLATGGVGSGSGRGARPAVSAESASTASPAQKTNGIPTVKTFKDKINGNPDPSLPLIINPPKR